MRHTLLNDKENCGLITMLTFFLLAKREKSHKNYNFQCFWPKAIKKMIIFEGM